jgi:GNAT superfamily N-acetyltransferase
VFDGATMLGFSAVHYKPMAEVVHRVHAARGVAQALVSHTLRAAQDQGYGRASLRVDADRSRGGFGLAERAGFVTQDTQVHYRIEL